MPEIVNTSSLASLVTPIQDDGRETMIKVSDVSMVFNMASQQLNSLKEYAIALARKELRFKEFRALDGISLEVKRGDVFGIMGTNGSGKSTLLKIVAGVLEPTTGTCTINGNIAPLIELGAGFDMELTARENIYLNGALLGYTKEFIDQSFDEIVDFAEVGSFLDMPLKNYSSGMVARIAFAIATVIVPDILIVDEVLSVGDFMFQQKCERRIQSLIKDHGVTVLIVSHSTDQIERLCNKVIWIEKGHTRIMGNAQEVCRLYRVLGGHIGSAESEQKVIETLQAKAEIPEGLISTVRGDDRYETAVLLQEQLERHHEYAIVAPGGHRLHCLLANTLSAALGGCPVYLTRTDALPNITAQALRHTMPHKVFAIGGTEQIEESVLDAIAERIGPDGAVVRVEGQNAAKTSQAVYRAAIDELGADAAVWGETAIVTYETCFHDVVSLLPFAMATKAPLFFAWNSEGVDWALPEVAQGRVAKRLVFLGDDQQYSDAYLDELATRGIQSRRFCGQNAYHANKLINEWLQELAAAGAIETTTTALVASIWRPADALAIGPYLNEKKSIVLLEETQDLDSVAYNLALIESADVAIERLMFIGDDSIFSVLDKEILAKAVLASLRS